MGLHQHHYWWEKNWKLLRHTRDQKTGLLDKKKFRNYFTTAEDRKQGYCQ
jgi:hypothetical protein